jgi:hypothetical protein
LTEFLAHHYDDRVKEGKSIEDVAEDEEFDPETEMDRIEREAENEAGGDGDNDEVLIDGKFNNV